MCFKHIFIFFPLFIRWTYGLQLSSVVNSRTKPPAARASFRSVLFLYFLFPRGNMDTVSSVTWSCKNRVEHIFLWVNKIPRFPRRSIFVLPHLLDCVRLPLLCDFYAYVIAKAISCAPPSDGRENNERRVRHQPVLVINPRVMRSRIIIPFF